MSVGTAQYDLNNRVTRIITFHALKSPTGFEVSIILTFGLPTHRRDGLRKFFDRPLLKQN